MFTLNVYFIRLFRCSLVPRDADVKHFVGRAQLCEFLSWLDYAKCLSLECSEMMTNEMCAHTRTLMMENVIEPSMIDGNAPFMLVLAAKIIHQLEAKSFLDGKSAFMLFF